VADEESQGRQKGYSDPQLLDDVLARWRQDAQCAPGKRKKMDAAEARQKARERKADALGAKNYPA